MLARSANPARDDPMLSLCFTAFVAFGVALVLIGAHQADLARELELGLAETGLLGSVLALGIGVGVVAAGPLFDRHRRRPLFAGACLIAAAALVSVEPGMGYARWLLHIALTGFGIGAYDTLINAVVVQRYGERAAKPMTIVHSAATLGAMAGPAYAGWMAARGHWSASFVWLGVAHLALAVWALAVRFPEPERGGVARRDGEREGVLSASMLPFGLVAFAYVGIEASLTIFAVPYGTGAFALGAERGRGAITAFWLGLLLGRLGVLGLRGPLDARVLFGAGTAGTLVLALGVGLGVRIVEAPFLAAGLALGCVYPVTIALVGQRFPHARGTAAGLAAGAGAAGGFAVPWLTGALGDATGVAYAVGSLALWSAAIAAAAAALQRMR